MEKKFFTLLFSLCLYSCTYGIPVADFFQAITVKNCGRNIFTPNSPDRIVGGKKTKRGQYPWMVSLQEYSDSEFEHICGAAILNENWIITAAHCIELELKHKPSNYQAIVGLYKLSQQNAATIQKISISKIILHEKYDDENFINDIALLKTARPIDIAGSKGYVNGICLPKTNNDPEGYAIVAGWGHTYENGENSDTLLHVVVPIVDRETCNKAYDDDPYDGLDEVTETMICAGRANRDSCQSDSGGPLIQTSKEGIATLIGVVSNGAGCGARYYPGIYTKVSAYKEWMQKIMNKQ